jgi:hypothetical protein
VAARLLQVVIFPYRGCSFTAVTGVRKLSRERQIMGLGSSHRVQASLSKGMALQRRVHGESVVVPRFGKSETSRKPPISITALRLESEGV